VCVCVCVFMPQSAPLFSAPFSLSTSIFDDVSVCVYIYIYATISTTIIFFFLALDDVSVCVCAYTIICYNSAISTTILGSLKSYVTFTKSLKLQVSFAKEPYKRDYILQERPAILRSLLIVATP